MPRCPAWCPASTLQKPSHVLPCHGTVVGIAHRRAGVLDREFLGRSCQPCPTNHGFYALLPLQPSKISCVLPIFNIFAYADNWCVLTGSDEHEPSHTIAWTPSWFGAKGGTDRLRACAQIDQTSRVRTLMIRTPSNLAMLFWMRWSEIGVRAGGHGFERQRRDQAK